MHKDITNWRELTDQEIKELFYNFVAVNCVLENFKKEEAAFAIACFNSWLKKMQDTKFVMDALSTIDELNLHENKEGK